MSRMDGDAWRSSHLALQRSDLLLQFGVHLVDLGPGAPSALAADDAGSSQEQQRRGHQQQNAKAGEDPNHLGTMPDHRGPRVPQLVLARSLVVVAQQEVILQEYKLDQIS